MKQILKNIALKLYSIGRNEYRKNIYKKFRLKYNIPESFRFNGEYINIYGNGNLQIGENSYVGSFSTIQIDENCIVSIGSNCKISHNVRIYTTSGYVNQDFNKEIQKFHKNVIIGDAVWIGANVFINPGVTIGHNSIIGANSVVTKDISENVVFGGVPAKKIRDKSYNA